jgi:hypothetical protein
LRGNKAYFRKLKLYCSGNNIQARGIQLQLPTIKLYFRVLKPVTYSILWNLRAADALMYTVKGMSSGERRG